MRVSAFDYVLPEERVAQHPVEPRDRARLLVARGEALAHRVVADLPALLPPALFVVNDTRVRRARLHARKPSGGRAEVLLLRPLGAAGAWLAMGRASKPIRPGTDLVVLDASGTPAPLRVRVRAKRGDGLLEVELDAGGADLEDAIERWGRVPLPPYVRREADDADAERYQTVFAREVGAAAAPTAGLHFTPGLLRALEQAGHALATVTLHVGLGTFQPVTAADLDEHPMHAEQFDVPERTARAIAEARRSGRPVVAVGTTVVRALETAAAGGRVRAARGETRLLVQPGHRFHAVDVLLTNFHLPRTTLLALACAFGGRERVLRAYEAAVREGYRFFSYGDAMLLYPTPGATAD